MSDSKEKQQQSQKQKQTEAMKAAGQAAKAAKAAKKAKAAQQDDAADEAPAQPAPPPRLLVRYQQEIRPALCSKLKMNPLEAPRLEKIVISMGLGKHVTAGEKIRLDQAEKELSVIAGQKPVRCKAKKSVANFKVREGMETGLKVTLRGPRMYEFFDRLLSVALPRVKDFRGLDPNAFDKAGNYNFGFTEQTVFPEVDSGAVTYNQGMNITLVTTARNPDDGRELLRSFGFPFRA